MTFEIIREQVLNAAKSMLAVGLTVGDSGNVSARAGERGGRVLLAITPTSRYYDELTPDDMVVVDETGALVEGEGKPSSEWPLHAAIYRTRVDVGAVVHAHPPLASTVAVVGRPIPPILEDQVIYLGGQIEVSPYAITGSRELVERAVEALGERNACLLGNHGSLTVGKDLKSAIIAGQYLEKLSQVFLSALWAGQVNVLPPDDVDKVTAFFRARK